MQFLLTVTNVLKQHPDDLNVPQNCVLRTWSQTSSTVYYMVSIRLTEVVHASSNCFSLALHWDCICHWSVKRNSDFLRNKKSTVFSISLCQKTNPRSGIHLSPFLTHQTWQGASWTYGSVISNTCFCAGVTFQTIGGVCLCDPIHAAASSICSGDCLEWSSFFLCCLRPDYGDRYSKSLSKAPVFVLQLS